MNISTNPWKIGVLCLDIILILVFLMVGTIGVVLFPGFLEILGLRLNDFPKVQLYQYHNQLGILLLVLTGFHIGIYWNQFKLSIKKLVRGKTFSSVRTTMNYSINVLLFLCFIIVCVTGIIRFPRFLPFIGISPVEVPLNMIVVIHDWSGVFVVGFSLSHLMLNMKKIIRAINTMKQCVHVINVK